MKPAAFAAASVPGARIAVLLATGRYGANPIAEALNDLGLAALILLLATLACTPLKRVLGWSWPLALRRMLGLFAFFYAAVHFTTYVVVDQGFDWGEIGKDIVKRKFMTIGFAAFTLLLPLALTSTNKMVKRLGFPRWKRLHRLIYAAAIFAVIHFFWRVKVVEAEQWAYAAVLALLLAARLAPSRARRARPASSASPPSSSSPPPGPPA